MTAVNETSAVLTDKTLPANAHNESLKSDDAAHLAERGALATDQYV
jgi:hypothetical protein